MRLLFFILVLVILLVSIEAAGRAPRKPSNKQPTKQQPKKKEPTKKEPVKKEPVKKEPKNESANLCPDGNIPYLGKFST